MKMTRQFFISDDLDDLERLEEELESAGLVTPQIHVLTLDDTGADRHQHLHQVVSFMKMNTVHSALAGAVLGLFASMMVLFIAYMAGWTESPAGWLPFVFLAIIALGFFTWEGAFLGFQTPNARFQQFEEVLRDGKHIFFVDLEPGQDKLVRQAVERHPSVEMAGTGRASPHWLVRAQHRIKHFFTHTFP